MTLHNTDIATHSEVEHPISEALELQQQFRYSIEQLTQAFQAYEGAADSGPSFMRHARKLVLDLSRNNINLIKYLEDNYQNLSHQLNIDKQNSNKFNLERANFFLGMNQFKLQIEMVQVLISLLMHSLQTQQQLRKDLEKQQQQLRTLQYKFELHLPKAPQPKEERLVDNARLARTMPFFPH